MNQLLKNWKILLFLTCLTISIAFITNIIPLNKDNGIGFGNGLDYGIDFAGGTQMQLKLEKEVDSDVMAIEKAIIENRLNSMGLRDIPVRAWGNQYLLVQIAQATPEETKNIENILKQQARFEERIDGELAIMGDEVTVDLGPQGIELYQVQGGYHWSVHVTHSKEGACRFGQVADGKRGRPVDIFIDRPQNTIILFSKGDYQLLSNFTKGGDTDRLFFDNTAIELIKDRARIPALELQDPEKTFNELDTLQTEGYTKIVLVGDESKIGDDIRNQLEEKGYATERYDLGDSSYIDRLPEILSDLIGLQSSPRLDFDTQGECVYQARITGSSPTLEEARSEVKQNQVLLTSGNLPVKLTLESKSTTPPTLGRKFLAYSLYTALVAVFAVALIIYLRYRRIEILLPVMATMIGDILIILGFAAFINWELDLPALAGILAAVGTGVDHQVIITDETLKRSKSKKLVSMAERVRKAFFIIFTAAATITAAMLPLMIIGAGMLKGFAFTTLMGVLIGITISRPAYASLIEHILKKSE